jgi:hypothetical protein
MTLFVCNLLNATCSRSTVIYYGNPKLRDFRVITHRYSSFCVWACVCVCVCIQEVLSVPTYDLCTILL